jgi:hypothetical protein
VTDESDERADAATVAALLGRWRLLRADPRLDFAPSVGMEFRARGELLYSFDVGGRRRAIALLYRVNGDMLRTDNPAAPHATATRFRLGAGDVLVLDFAGAEACFIRERP